MQVMRWGVGDTLDHGQDDTEQDTEGQQLGTDDAEDDVAGVDSRQVLPERTLVQFHHSGTR